MILEVFSNFNDSMILCSYHRKRRKGRGEKAIAGKTSIKKTLINTNLNNNTIRIVGRAT